MSDELVDEFHEITKTDAAASEACTRSATFALGLCIVLFVLGTSWAHRPSELALEHYVYFRYNLALAVERLDESPIWKTYKASNPLAEATPIVKLPTETTKTISRTSAPVEKAQKQSAMPKEIPKFAQRPAAPTGFAVSATEVFKMPEISWIIDTLRNLNNSELLTNSRDYSNFFNFSIAGWAQKRGDLIYRNAIDSSCATKEIEVPHENKTRRNFVPEIDSDVLLECLTLEDVRDLDQFERPVMTNPDQIGGHVGREIDIAPGSLPREPYMASLVSQGLLFFVLMYFAAFTRESTSSKSFPAPGTLFGAFSKSRWTLFTMALGLCTPAAASIWVAIESKRPVLWAGAGLTLIVVWWIATLLKRNSYWAILWKRTPSSLQQPIDAPLSS